MLSVLLVLPPTPYPRNDEKRRLFKNKNMSSSFSPSIISITYQRKLLPEKGWKPLAEGTGDGEAAFPKTEITTFWYVGSMGQHTSYLYGTFYPFRRHVPRQ